MKKDYDNLELEDEPVEVFSKCEGLIMKNKIY